MNSSKVNYESSVITFTQINSGVQPLTGYWVLQLSTYAKIIDHN